MDDTVRYTVLTLVVLAYVGGGVLVMVSAARAALTWSTGRRARRRPDAVDPALQQHAAAAMRTVAQLANVDPPRTQVVALLGASRGTGEVIVGDGGLAVTRFRPGQPPTVVFAQAALTDLTPAALRSLAAHELAHVIDRARGSAAARYVWLLGYLLLMLIGLVLSVAALAAAPRLAGPAALATMLAAVAFLALQVAFDRREEIAADRFSITLTRDLAAAAELMGFYEEHLARPAPRGRFGGWRARFEQRWFATHPAPAVRLEAMRRHLVDQPSE
jgi:Zn-dependent protease with chaperone function